MKEENKLNDDIAQLLHGPFYQVNIKLIKIYGINTALFISHIVSKYNYFKKNNMINEEGYFYNIKDQIEEETSLTSTVQYRITKKLIENKILKVKKRGLPAKNYYKIDFIKLASVLNTDSHFKCKSLDIYKSKINNIKDNNTKNSSSKEEESKQACQLIIPKLINRKKLRRALKETTNPITDKKVQKAIEYWNTKGKPFPRHTIQNSKIIKSINKKLKKKIRKNNLSLSKIIEAIDTYYNFITSPLTVHSKPFNMSQFLLFDQYQYSKQNKVEINSWFDECLKGKDYLFKTYGKYVKNNNPELTEKIWTLWKKNSLKVNKDIPYMENNFRIAADKLVSFINENNSRIKLNKIEKNPLMFVNYLFGAALNGGGGDTDRMRPGSISNNYFFDEILPTYLKKRGLM